VSLPHVLHGVDAHFDFVPPPVGTASFWVGSRICIRSISTGSRKQRRFFARNVSGYDALGNHRPVGVDGDVLHNDLLLAATSVLIQALSQHSDCPRRWAPSQMGPIFCAKGGGVLLLPCNLARGDVTRVAPEDHGLAQEKLAASLESPFPL
jgi:hypothetical protein